MSALSLSRESQKIQAQAEKVTRVADVMRLEGFRVTASGGFRNALDETYARTDSMIASYALSRLSIDLNKLHSYAVHVAGRSGAVCRVTFHGRRKGRLDIPGALIATYDLTTKEPSP